MRRGVYIMYICILKQSFRIYASWALLVGLRLEANLEDAIVVRFCC